MNLLVWVAALGYFVDMYDITLFGVVRTSSLAGLGLTDPNETLKAGILLYNMQALGMVIGGVLWGVMADKKGRLSVLFGSILLYSVSNILNAFVTSVEQYAICRFVTGLGLAGELGAAITLVSESLSKEKRGIGTTIVATMGLFGAVCASFIGQLLTWQTNYIVGGVMGLLLLFTRFQVSESEIFKKATQTKTSSQGNFKILFQAGRWQRYLRCILLGTPVYFMTGIMFTFSPELTSGLGIQGDPVRAGQALLYGTIGLTLGDLFSGLLSQYLRSRKKSVMVSLSLASAGVLVYLLVPGLTAQTIYFLCFILGLAGGYWAVLVTMSAEQFGTNIRGTVATSVPNFVRGTAILMTLSFNSLKNYFGIQNSALMIAAVSIGFAFVSLFMTEETFSKDLNYIEE